MTRAALYLRQSLDREKTELGIDRQRERTTALAEARGWEVVGEYVDNDVSATKPRGPGTAWHRLADDARAGRVDVIVAVDVDRLLRTLTDLVTLTSLGVKVTTVDGEIDLASADGEFRATIAAGLARFEGRRKSERQKRAHEQSRLAGIPKAGRTPYGYRWVPKPQRIASGRPDPYLVVDEEAAVIREAYGALMSGTTLAEICRTLERRGIRTRGSRRNPEGTPWRPSTLRRVFLSPFYAALIPEPNADGSPYDLEGITRERCVSGAWEAIVTEESWLEAKALLGSPTRRANGGTTSRKWLLSGLAICGVCEEPIRAGGGAAGIHSYRCRSMAHFMRRGDPLDQYIEGVLVERLSRPDAAVLLTPRSDPDEQAHKKEYDAIAASLRRVDMLVETGVLTKDEARAPRERHAGELAALRAKSNDSTRVAVLEDIVSSDDVARTWFGYPLDRKRAILDALVVVVVHSVGQGGRSQSMQRMKETTELRWR
ncbi:recombinase family protein [Clavibacter michiganensis subsp. phaseoli]|uniref:recombinase family protein n=1 Tax=Clavibacter phaseoli TaxID=1734031 RepID=UPI001FB2F52F|nr:recombinase family protein [Clavibacter phaseoli]MCJ1710359.1 recombinase family protein [Clavibacter phaseoli]